MNLFIGMLLAAAGVFLLIVGVKGTYPAVVKTLGIGSGSSQPGSPANGSIPDTGGFPAQPTDPNTPAPGVFTT